MSSPTPSPSQHPIIARLRELGRDELTVSEAASVLGERSINFVHGLINSGQVECSNMNASGSVDTRGGYRITARSLARLVLTSTSGADEAAMVDAVRYLLPRLSTDGIKEIEREAANLRLIRRGETPAPWESQPHGQPVIVARSQTPPVILARRPPAKDLSNHPDLFRQSAAS